MAVSGNIKSQAKPLSKDQCREEERSKIDAMLKQLDAHAEAQASILRQAGHKDATAQTVKDMARFYGREIIEQERMRAAMLEVSNARPSVPVASNGGASTTCEGPAYQGNQKVEQEMKQIEASFEVEAQALRQAGFKDATADSVHRDRLVTILVQRDALLDAGVKVLQEAGYSNATRDTVIELTKPAAEEIINETRTHAALLGIPLVDRKYLDN